MKTTLITIAFAVAVSFAIILILAATRPDNFQVQRAASIKAPPEKIFALINDFHNWGAWSPYEKRDPAMNRSFSGSVDGRGAVYEWAGNKKVGAGRMEIIDTSAASTVRIKLDFIRPFEGHNIAEFTLRPQGDATNVTWAMDGPSPFIAKVMGLFFNMDHMIGKDFETGLANLKTLTER